VSRIEGDLSLLSAADLIIWVGNRAHTGRLVFERAGHRKLIQIQEGAAVHAASTDPREFIGQFLVNFGLVTEEQLTRAFQTQQETKVMLGRILIMIGLCSEDQVRKTLEFQIRETMLDAITWSDGRFVFEATPSAGPPRDDLRVHIPLVDIHQEGAQRAKHWEAIRTAFPNEHLSLAVNESRVPPGIRPETFEGRILQRARAGLTIESVKIDLHSTDFVFYARLYELYRQGALEPRETGPIQPFVEYSPVPPGPHGELAQAAYERANYQDALRYAQAGVAEQPANRELAELQRKAEQKRVEQVRAALPSQDAVPRLLQPVELILRRRISAKERYILTRIDGSKSVREITQISPMREVEAAEIFRRLQEEGLIGY
jgi:hypothetical protein